MIGSPFACGIPLSHGVYPNKIPQIPRRLPRCAGRGIWLGGRGGLLQGWSGCGRAAGRGLLLGGRAPVRGPAGGLLLGRSGSGRGFVVAPGGWYPARPSGYVAALGGVSSGNTSWDNGTPQPFAAKFSCRGPKSM